MFSGSASRSNGYEKIYSACKVDALSMDVDATAVAAAAAAPADWVLVDHQLEVDGTIFAF